MATGYLTPDTIPADTICRVLFIPNDVKWIANVYGALEELTFPENFFPFGAVDPQATADIYAIMFGLLLNKEGSCRLIGEVVCYASTTNPDPIHWIRCDGSSWLRTDYPDLFAVIGTTFGAVDGTHFNVPDLQGRSIVGEGSGSGLTPRAEGDTFGEESHVLTVAELASHNHVDSGHTHAESVAAPTAIAIGVGVPAPSALPTVGFTGTGFAGIGNTGSDNPHNNEPPSVVISFYIVASE